MNLTRTAITRPVFILMLVMAAVLMGIVSYRSMRVELNPEVSFPTVTVNTIYPGAGPEEVSTLVSKRIEDAISGVASLRELSSTSREGQSIVVAQFELGAGVDVALNDVRSRVDSIINQLPDDAERPSVVRFDTSSEPVLYLAFTSTARNSQLLRDLLDNTLSDRFSQIQGVAQVSVQGGDVREIQIQLDQERLRAYGVGITEVARQITAGTQNIPGGRVTSGDKQYSVRVLGEWKSVDQIRNTILSISDPDNPQATPRRVRLSDIATVSDAVEERQIYSRLNGKDTIVLAIQKTREGNAIQITRQADELIAGIVKDYPDLKITKTLEQAKRIEESLDDLWFTLAFGVFLVAGVVYVFLHDFRGTLIVAIAIPICFGAAIGGAALAGFSINNMTMLALILAVGVLVDDAIVVLENIYRHLKLGEDPREAALNGRSEIGLAAIAITLADVVVFLPVAFMGGIVGQFFKPLALTYVITVLVSMFVSFTVTPMLAARWYRAGEDVEHAKGRFAKGFERMFGRLERGYGRSLEWALNHRWFVFILGNSALIAIFMFIGGGSAAAATGNPAVAPKVGMGPFMAAVVIGVVVFIINLLQRRFKPQLLLYGALFGLLFPVSALLGGFYGAWKGEAVFKGEFIPNSDAAQVNVSVKLPPDASLAASERVVARIEKIMMADPNVKYVTSRIGTQSAGAFGGGNSGSNYAQVVGTLYEKGATIDKMPWKKHEEKLRWVSDTSVAASLLQKIGKIPGAELKVSAQAGNGFGSPIQLSLRSENSELIAATANKIKQRLLANAVPGIINADISTTPGRPELRALPDRDQLADAGLTVRDLGFAMRTLYNGDETARFRVNGEEYKIRVQLSPKEKNNPNIVNEVPVAFKQGAPITLGSVATLREEPSVDQIQRRDRIQEIQVTADLLPGYAAGTVQQQLNTWIEREKMLPEGVTMGALGQAQAQAREMGGLIGAFLLGLVLVYMVLASLYDNLLYPFIIQLAQPQALTGAILALALTDKPLNLVGFIGLVTLVGLVGKNAILLVDYTNTLRDRGRNRHDALVEAGPVRLRPIMMTTMALVLGMLPIALAFGRGSEFRETIGIIIIGGMVLSTLMTLLVIPCSYTIFDDLSNWAGGLFGRRRRKRDSGAAELTLGTTESEAPRPEERV